MHRENNRIITDWYTKTIASGRIINYHSTQPLRQKLNTANNLIQKALTLSHGKFRNKNIKKLEEIMENNNYPKHVIRNLITKNTTREIESNTRGTEDIEPSGNTKYYSLPYIPKLTEERKMKEIIEDKNITISHKPQKTLTSLFTRTKTKVNAIEESNVVYEIKCKGNAGYGCGKVYIGTTKRSLGTRLAEHDADIRKGNAKKTALSQHCVENGHAADLNDVRILDREKRQNKRYTLESLRIQQKQKCAINTKEDKDNTNACYSIAIV